MQGSNSFTLAHNGIAFVLQTPCSICPGFDPATAPQPSAWCKFPAIWDTGATGCVITQRVIDECGLKPIGMTRIHGVHGVSDSETYLVNLLLLNNVGLPNITVTKGDLPSGANVLIGMNVITTGDFCITNYEGKTVFSFRIPSQRRVDYVAEHNAQAVRPPLTHRGSKGARKRGGKAHVKKKKH